MNHILEVSGLKKYFPVRKGLLLRTRGWTKAVDGIDFSVEAGQTLALAGESGCGKSTTAKLILLLEKPTSGAVLFGGDNLSRLDGKGLKEYRRSVQAVLQDPYSSLDPRMRIESIVGEPLLVNTKTSRGEIKEKVSELLRTVGLRPGTERLYAHELSGGQRQRVALARAISLYPRLIVLDEPVSALDVSIRAQMMNLLKEIQDRMGVAYLLIAHHLGTMRYLSHEVAIMYLGKIVEFAPCEELYSNPLHPYTQALLAAALPSHPDAPRQEVPLPQEVPSALNVPKGCRFHPRCPRAMPVCSEVAPQDRVLAGKHRVACHLF